MCICLYFCVCLCMFVALNIYKFICQNGRHKKHSSVTLWKQAKYMVLVKARDREKQISSKTRLEILTTWFSVQSFPQNGDIRLDSLQSNSYYWCKIMHEQKQLLAFQNSKNIKVISPNYFLSKLNRNVLDWQRWWNKNKRFPLYICKAWK